MTGDLLSASWDPGDAGLAGVWLPEGFEVEYAEPGGREVRASLDRLRRVDLGACLPVRSFPSYKGQRNYPGWFWSATMGKLVGFESWVERGHLVALDFALEVTAIVSQPFWLCWRTPAGKIARHAPGPIRAQTRQGLPPAFRHIEQGNTPLPTDQMRNRHLHRQLA
ncbi:hypothetical protein LAUMK4_05636 [Mycobacterium persicum]|uniref:Transposase n=1 Tax=Mycobacterium persicum TaxID=1487726 RepID=A0ABY6RS19_9MYCO|nr:hypothetical protein [Mycobacterium persicum]VBA31961.1 hypothetical protein LAUMK4_05636 [Mycobacterium persicum]